MQGSAQNAAMQEAMQLMFGQDGGAMQAPLDTAAQDEQGIDSNKPAVMQRLSALAQAPAISSPLRPFNMLINPDSPASFLQRAVYSAQSGHDGSFDPGQYSAPEVSADAANSLDGMYADVDVNQLSQLQQPRLSMTGVMNDALSAQEPWLNSAGDPNPSEGPPSIKTGHKHSTAASGKHHKSKSRQLHAIPEAAAQHGTHEAESDMRSEFSFSPLGDSSSRIQDIAFSPLAVGAGQAQARPSVAQHIRKSLFGPARNASKADDTNLVKVRKCLMCFGQLIIGRFV